MPRELNFLLAKGERLTTPTTPPGGGGPKKHPYSFEEAQARIKPLADATTRESDALPPIACPQDQAVAVITLHPAYLAKSYHPADLLNAGGLRPVGSRLSTV